MFSNEPLTNDSPLFSIDNVLLSPHISGNFLEYQEIMIKQFNEMLVKFVNGKESKIEFVKKAILIMSSLYPPISPYNTFNLKVSNLHTIFVEESGNPNGKPVIFLHGGPGGGSEAIYRQYFNPEKMENNNFDQRGCEKSIPHAELQENTTWDLIEDIEKIRKELDISNWSVFGGSWGSTLALSYAIKKFRELR